MIKSLLVFCAAILLSSCVELPDLFPNGEGEDLDMLIIEVNDPLIDAIIPYPDTIRINDSITIILSLQNSEVECSDIRLSIQNGQILKELGSYDYYSGLSEGSLLGNTTLGSWKNSYLTTERQTSPSLVCFNDHLFERNKDIYLGFRIKFSDNQWHYGWLNLAVQDFFPSLDQVLAFREIGVNINSGINVRIGE